MQLFVKIAVAVVITLFISFYFAVFLFQGNLLFYPTPLSMDYRFNLGENGEEIFLETEDHERINALYFFKPRSKSVVLYFHGNGGSLDSWQTLAPDFLKLNLNLMIIDYRGYGKSTGSFSEKGFYRDAEAAFGFLLQKKNYSENQIILFGRSIGSGVATEMAVRHPHVKALILETPFTRLVDLAQEKMPWTLPHLFLRFRFNNLSRLKKLSVPLLIIHGTDDEIIPYSNGQELFESYRGPKEFLSIKGGNHNNLSDFTEHDLGIERFLQQH